MKTSQLLTVVVASLLITLSGCKKYEEGPLVSLRSKKERVANDWRIGKALENGKDVTDQYHKYDYDISKDGKVTLSADFTILGNDFVYVTTGVWAFLNNSEKLSFDFEGSDSNLDYIILKLEEKEMWLKETDGKMELHFIPR